LPSQAPSVPQLAAPWSAQRPRGSAFPSAMFEQWPREPDSTHDWHVPPHAPSQQTPCAQNVDWHSPPSAHVLPSPFKPQDPFVQTAGAAHAASLVQAALQTPAPHWNGKHELALGVTHAPWPSQVEPGVKVVVPAGQVEPAHAVPEAYFWQAPAWHLPFVPQLAGPWSAQRPAGSVAPAGTFVHVPSEPVSAQDVQAPLQAVSQQTPCAQNDDWHSLGSEQEAPRIFLPQELPLQTLFVVQFLSVVHASKQVSPLQT
jgi:hypothetical protein